MHNTQRNLISQLSDNDDKFTLQYSENTRIKWISDSTKYYSGIRVIGFQKKAVPVKATATVKKIEKYMIKKSAISLISYDANMFS